MKIEQSPSISIAALKTLADSHEGPLTININLQANGNIDADTAQISNETLLAYIQTFPEPRLRNFINYIYFTASKKYGKSEAARRLTINYRTLCRLEGSRVI